MASRNCGCRKATVYLQIECGQATWSAMPRRYSICGKQSAAEYTSLRAANLFAIAMASRNCGCRKATETALPRRYSICGKHCAAEYTRTFRHLNRDKTQEIHYNTLRDFSLYGFSRHLHWFRFSGKGKHLNLEAKQNPATKPLTTNALQDFQRLYPRFRSLAWLEHRGMQTCPGGASGWGIRQTRNRTAQASEPRQNPRNSPQHIEKLPIARFKQAHSQVQMQQKREASEPYSKTKFHI